MDSSFEPYINGLEYAKLLLLFKVHLIVNQATRTTKVVDMAFIKMYDDFAETVHPNNFLSDHGPPDKLWECGFQRLYEIQTEEGPQLEVIPVSRIVGTAPLVPDFMEGECVIPQSVKQYQKHCFPRGKASAGQEKGSSTAYVSPHAMSFGRM